MAKATTTNKILDAAVNCFGRDSIDKVTMSDIIIESGLARATVYRHFPVKDDIISQVVIRDVDNLVQHLDIIRSRYEHLGLERQMVEVLYFTIEEVGKQPLLAELFSQNPARISKLGLSNARVVEYSQQAALSTYELIKASGRLRKGMKLVDFSDWCRRVFMSFVIAPHEYQGNPVKLKRYIREIIVPSMMIPA